MTYDETLCKIKISVKEFVRVARRAISPSPLHDGDGTEGEISRPVLLSLGIGEMSALPPLEADVRGEGFVIEGSAVYDSQSVTVVKRPHRASGSPDSELTKSARGEGFVAAYMLMAAYGIKKIKLTIIYIFESSGEKIETHEEVAFSSAERFFNKCLTTVSIYSRPERERVKIRLQTMRSLKFPYKSIREGQGEFVRRAYKTICRGGSLFALAPTGTGKTVSALYPALRAMGEGRCSKIFYLTPKTTTARAACECIELLCLGGANIRAAVITSKEHSCKNGLRCRDGRDMCDASKCKKIADAALELYDLGLSVVTVKNVDTVSRKYGLCPYELELTYAELCDVVICDFNYLFDPRAYVRRFFSLGGDYCFLIDEAHNLADRAREMFSAEISAEEVSEPSALDLLGEFSRLKRESLDASHALFDLLYPYIKDELRITREGAEVGAAQLSDVPGGLFPIFERLIRVCEEEISENLRAADCERTERLRLLRDYYYKIKRVWEALAEFDSAYRLFIFYEGGELRFKLFCIDTGRRISECVAKGRSSVFFSATLAPLDYYKAVLGGDRSAEVMEVDSPFSSEQLAVAIMDKISTRYSEREDTLLAVCRTVAATLSAKRGNYIVFSPSFAYSEALAKTFRAKYPKIKTLMQTKNMTAGEKADFLSAFEQKSDSYLVAFCVMGGIFAEGVDLAGDALIGAVVIGIGLPTLSYEREAISAYFDEKYEAGGAFAYVYPGMNRVLQAAGRVIRREEDRGVIVLIDDRFDNPIYKDALPKLWRGVKFIGSPAELKSELAEFWGGLENE